VRADYSFETAMFYNFMAVYIILIRSLVCFRGVSCIADSQICIGVTMIVDKRVCYICSIENNWSGEVAKREGPIPDIVKAAWHEFATDCVVIPDTEIAICKTHLLQMVKML
jgi:hypothetical protein